MKWESKRLADLGVVSTGSTPRTAFPHFYGGDIPFVTPADLDSGEPIIFSPRSLTAEGAAEARMLPEGAVMVCCIGTLGKIGIAGRSLATNQQINSVIFDQTLIFPKFGYYACRLLKPEMECMAPATTLPIISKSKFQELQIPLPPLAEQKRIARILDAADALRAKRREALAQLDALLQSTFLALFGDPVTNPMGWEVVLIGDQTTKLGSGSTPTGGSDAYKNEGISLIRSLNVRDGEFRYKDLALIDDNQAAKLSGVVVAENDILLNITGASVARICRAPKSVLPARVNQHVCIIRPKSSINSSFLEHLLLTPQTKRKLLRIGGAGATREAITKAQLKQFELICPPLPLQQKFARIVESVERQKTAQRAHLAELDALFASLQHRAFRGEL